MKKFLSNPVSRLCEQSAAIQSPFPHSSASSPRQSASSSGFTLLELLIVVSIIAILSVALVLVLNPAEALRKSRDAQRMSDMATMKTALGLYLTSTTTPFLGSNTANDTCRNAATGTSAWTNNDRIFYSSVGQNISDVSLDSFAFTAPGGAATSTTPSVTDGNGWIPVNFDSLTGGSPISNLPIDPTNILTVNGITNADLVYRYACLANPLSFEIDAILESAAYASSSPTTDGGNNANYYEVGTNLKILGAGTDF